MLIDVRYAINQLRPLVAAPASIAPPRLESIAVILKQYADRTQRALDALDRVEETMGQVEEE